MTHAMGRESHQNDSCFGVGNQVIENLVESADWEAVVCRPSPDDFCQLWVVTRQTIDGSHGRRNFGPRSRDILAESFR
jgi:hypothetical protein